MDPNQPTDPNQPSGEASQAPADPNATAGESQPTDPNAQANPGEAAATPADNPPADAPIKPSNDEIHEFRKEVDAVIVKAQELQKRIGYDAGGREISLVVTKLQEGKMWAGKILEAFGSPFPADLADKSE
jgi:hypothetical protein